MHLQGKRSLPGRPEQVWTMLLDPDVLVSAIPGCEKLERVGEDHYEGVIDAKVGSVQSTYETTFKIKDKNPPESYRLDVEGEGSAGFVSADVLMALSEREEGGTLMRYDGEADVGGRIAQIGQRMVRATAEAMLDRGFNALRDRIEQDLYESAAASGDGQAARASRPPGAFQKAFRNFFSTVRAFFRGLFASQSGGSSAGGARKRAGSRQEGQKATSQNDVRHSEQNVEEENESSPMPPAPPSSGGGDSSPGKSSSSQRSSESESGEDSSGEDSSSSSGSSPLPSQA